MKSEEGRSEVKGGRFTIRTSKTCSCVSKRSRELSVGNEKQLQPKQQKRLLLVTTRRQPGWRRRHRTLPSGSRRSTTH